MTKPLWLFIDFDNTMMGTEQYSIPILVKRFNELYADKIGREMTIEEFETNFQGDARETLCRKLSDYFNIHIDYPILFANREALMMNFLQENGAPMAENLVETLEELAQQNIKFAFASNNTIQRCLAAMRYATNGKGETLARLFGTHYFESGAIQKPDPDIYLRAIKQTGADPARSFAIEDSLTGARAALSAELKTFGYLGFAEHPETREKELLNLGVTACFRDWSEFPALLKTIITP